jgi:hypothetical protein
MTSGNSYCYWASNMTTWTMKLSHFHHFLSILLRVMIIIDLDLMICSLLTDMSSAEEKASVSRRATWTREATDGYVLQLFFPLSGVFVSFFFFFISIPITSLRILMAPFLIAMLRYLFFFSRSFLFLFPLSRLSPSPLSTPLFCLPNSPPPVMHARY